MIPFQQIFLSQKKLEFSIIGLLRHHLFFGALKNRDSAACGKLTRIRGGKRGAGSAPHHNTFLIIFNFMVYHSIMGTLYISSRATSYLLLLLLLLCYYQFFCFSSYLRVLYRYFFCL